MRILVADRARRLLARAYERDAGDPLSSFEAVAWAELFEDLCGMVFNYARLATGRDDDAATVLSHVFVAAVRREAKSPAQPERMPLVLLHLAYDASDRVLKSRKKASGRTQAPREHLQRYELAFDALPDPLARLDPRRRDLLVLRLLEGWATSDVAAVAGARERAVKAMMRRALESDQFTAVERHEGGGFDDVLDECISSLLRGERLEEVIAGHRQRTMELLPALRTAQTIIRLPRFIPDVAQRNAARDMLRREVDMRRITKFGVPEEKPETTRAEELAPLKRRRRRKPAATGEPEYAQPPNEDAVAPAVEDPAAAEPISIRRPAPAVAPPPIPAAPFDARPDASAPRLRPVRTGSSRRLRTWAVRTRKSWKALTVAILVGLAAGALFALAIRGDLPDSPPKALGGWHSTGGVEMSATAVGANGRTVLVRQGSSMRNVQVADTTQFARGDAPASQADLRPSMPLNIVGYLLPDGRIGALRITMMPPEGG